MNATYEYDYRYPCTAYQSTDRPTDVSIIAADHPVQPVSIPACVFVTCPPTPDRLHAHKSVHECVRVCFFLDKEKLSDQLSSLLVRTRARTSDA